MKTIKCAVFCVDSNGSPSICFYQLRASSDQITQGDHRATALLQCEGDGYDPVLACDEDDPAWASLIVPSVIKTVPMAFKSGTD